MPFEAICSVLCASLLSFPTHIGVLLKSMVLDKVSSFVIFNTGLSIASVS